MNRLLLLLERCGVDPAIAGDLAEEYRSGRSRGWLVWQAIVAAAVASGRGMRQHKILTIRAILVGLISVRGVSGFVYMPLRETIDSALTAHGFSGPPLWFVFEPYVVNPVLFLVCGMAVGWIIGSSHRPHSVPVVAGFAVVAVLTIMPEIYRLLLGSMTNTRFIPYLYRQISHAGMTVVGLLLGAVLSASPSEHTEPQS